MLTLKVITEETDRVIRGLEKKHFKGAQESIAKVIELNDKRRGAQNQLDKNLAEVNQSPQNRKFHPAPCQIPVSVHTINILRICLASPLRLPPRGIYTYSLNQVLREICHLCQKSVTEVAI